MRRRGHSLDLVQLDLLLVLEDLARVDEPLPVLLDVGLARNQLLELCHRLARIDGDHQLAV